MLQTSMPLIPCIEKFCFDKSSFVESSCEILCLKLLCLKPPWPAAGVSCELTGQLSSSQCFPPGLSETLCASHPAGFTHLPPTLLLTRCCQKEAKYEEGGGRFGRKRNKSLRHDRRIISDEHQQRCREIRTQKCRSLHCDKNPLRIVENMSFQVLLPAKFNEFCLVLGVKEMCCLEPEKKILEKAFRKKALKCHPDKVSLTLLSSNQTSNLVSGRWSHWV